MSEKSSPSMFFEHFGRGHDAFSKMHIAVLTPAGFLTSSCGKGFNLVSLKEIEAERKENPHEVAEDLEKYFCKRCLKSLAPAKDNEPCKAPKAP